MMPPTDIPAADLWSQIIAIPRASRLVDFPRNKPGTTEPICQVRMCVLTKAETMAAAADAELTTRKMLREGQSGLLKDKTGVPLDKGDRATVLESCVAIELLWRCCKDPSDESLKKPFFPAKELIALHLTSDEVAVLVNCYLITQATLGPIMSELSPVEQEAWVGRLMEGGDAFPLARLSWGAVTQLLSFLASRASNSQTDISSPSWPPSEDSMSA